MEKTTAEKGLVWVSLLAVACVGGVAIVALLLLARRPVWPAPQLPPYEPDALSFQPAPPLQMASPRREARAEVMTTALSTASQLIAMAPDDGRMVARVRVVGPAGAYAYFGTQSSAVAAGAGNVAVLGVGAQEMKFKLRPGQGLYGAGSVDGTLASVTLEVY